jgi:hypothetical protein
MGYPLSSSEAKRLDAHKGYPLSSASLTIGL